MHCGYVIEVKELRPHPNADRLQILTCFGTETCVGLDVKIGDKGIYFPPDLQLSEEFCTVHDLVRRKDEHGNDAGGFLEPGKRNIKAIRLRGERSDGFYMPIKCLEYTGADLADFTPGTQITIVNGKEICKKYIPRSNKGSNGEIKGPKTRKKKAKDSFPYFVEHIDTPQLRFNMSMFKPGDIICLTEKVHGTSSRHSLALLKRKSNIFTKIFGNKNKYKFVNGTRRTTITATSTGFYGSNEFRIKWGDKLKDKLHPGEEVFGEIAGFLEDGTPIMGVCFNKKTNDKEFIKKYGEQTTFSYGCDPAGYDKDKWCDEQKMVEKPYNRFFIYRMTYTTPEGYVIEYPWDLVKRRAEEMGFETVPELDRFIYTTEEDFNEHIAKWMNRSSTLDPTHIIEGVVVRALNATNFKVAKEKEYFFKVLEGIIKSEANAPDLEEQEEILDKES